jgi:dihydroneopterin aldolase/D-erythro-7,8-dihydroneopterin triphosphate epimerase
MLDKIFLKDITFQGIIGILPEERVNKQKIVINLELFCDISKAGKSDDINDTVNYKEIFDQIEDCIKNNYLLVEKLAEEIAKICLINDKVLEVMVRVEKPEIIDKTKSVGVEIRRGKIEAK